MAFFESLPREGCLYCRTINNVRPIKFSYTYVDGYDWLITILSFTGPFLRQEDQWSEVHTRDMVLSAKKIWTVVRESGSLRQDKSKLSLFEDGKISFYAREVNL